MQNHIVCSGCRNVLFYPGGATNVCCAVCNTLTALSPPGTDMAQLVCGGCRTLLMYARCATSVRCSCCNTINIVSSAGQVAHVNCGQCRTTLMYPYGAPSVKCAICHYVTNVGTSNVVVPVPLQTPNGTLPSQPVSQCTASPLPRTPNQTVIVENPTSVDECGKLVNNVVVGVTAESK